MQAFAGLPCFTSTVLQVWMLSQRLLMYNSVLNVGVFIIPR
jgi:hypothetical protein